ncbi:MAG: phosphoribosylformylglycinamidine synthase subunit PurL [Planctomycetes bacterium]|nr:phosphoribosylformylglycinamidine synthase subunit PurL [Planctomycetota bacterium]
MRWQIAVSPLSSATDSLGHVIRNRLRAFGLDGVDVHTARLFYLEGDLNGAAARRVADGLLADPVVGTATVDPWDDYTSTASGSVSVFRRAGVMDPVEAGVLRGAKALGCPVERAATAFRYEFGAGVDDDVLTRAAALLSNPAIEECQLHDDRFPPRATAGETPTGRIEVPLRDADPAGLEAVSTEGGLSLTLLEMQEIQAHFRKLGREPTDIELESLAQTWSEHCKHKTLAGAVRYEGDEIPGVGGSFAVDNLLTETIKEATHRLARDFCLSVFHDNAGVIAFEGDQALCFKVETHNHPSAIEPYGGAGTGIGGVIRDILGTGLGARPVANTNVFCVGPPDMAPGAVPKGAQHPVRILKGVVSGVRDYGNQMGIPTVNGAVFFDQRYVGNPLVYCGTIGIIPKDKVEKTVVPGTAIVAIGGRTGRDGIHGATFSSVELHEDSERVDSGAVQIGNAITEKKVLDVLLQARDRGLYVGITDCGAGGFSSAVGEMAEHCGAEVHLDRAPLKYAGLSASEIWISEAQERMVFSVPQENVDAMLALCASEDVEAVVLGTFTGTGRLELHYHGEVVGDLDMAFLHDGLPRITRTATWSAPSPDGEITESTASGDDLLAILSDPNVASKEWIIRQYDHEVQAGSVVKPLVGTRGQGPSDGSVIAPMLGNRAGFAVGCGMNPRYGDLDPYHMAQAAIDEALRNVVSVGGDPDHCAILDNFSWGNTNYPDRLGGLVRASYGCRDAAIALRTPFISGKDSLNNEYKVGDETIVIPPSLLVSALARVPDVGAAVTMDLKAPGNLLYVVGETADELGGSAYAVATGIRAGDVPKLNADRARRTFLALHAAMRRGLVRSCHDLSEGGLAAAAAEMVIAGEVGARVSLRRLPKSSDDLWDTASLFSESLSRFLVEVTPEQTEEFERALDGLPAAAVGETLPAPELVMMGTNGATLIELSATVLEDAWRPALTRWLEDIDPEPHRG